MAHMTVEMIHARDEELTAFKHAVLENGDKTVAEIVDTFDFQRISVDEGRAFLIVIGHDARRYPHRVPPKK